MRDVVLESPKISLANLTYISAGFDWALTDGIAGADEAAEEAEADAYSPPDLKIELN